VLLGYHKNNILVRNYTMPDLLSDLALRYTIRVREYSGDFSDAGTIKGLQDAAPITESYPCSSAKLL
jgi:hypothetical protein